MNSRSWGIPLTWVVISLVVVTVLCIYRPFVTPDETRYAAVAWGMWTRGDWLVPHLNGVPYSHKPPMLFWLIKAGWSVFGVNDWWPRVMTALFGVAGQLLTFRLARRLWPGRPDTALLGASILLGSVWWALYFGLLMFDLVLTAFVLLSLDAVLSAAAGKLRGWFFYALGIGLGILTKGPVILLFVLPAALLAPWWQEAGRAWTRWYACLAGSVLAGAALALAWALPAAAAGGEQYAHAILWGQTADRMAHSFAHARPIWWYVPLLPLILLPWSICPAVWRSLWRFPWRTLEASDRFVLSWLMPAFIALSLVSGKQLHYLMPLVPAIALLLGRAIGRTEVTMSLRDAMPLGLMMTLIGVAWLVLPHMPLASKRDISWIGEIAPLWSLLPFSFAALCIVVPQVRITQSVTRFAALFLLFYAALHPALVSSLIVRYDVRPMALHVSDLQSSGIEVANVGTYNGEYHYYGRLERPLTEVAPGLLNEWLSEHCRAWVVQYARTADPPQGFTDGYWQLFRNGSLMLAPAVEYPGHESSCEGSPAASRPAARLHSHGG
jgi:4-amino-4-deoxy-L-arabinose transferase-like glycosyltransferase